MEPRSNAAPVSPRAASGLTRQERIRQRPEFLRVQNRGRRTRGRHLTIFTLPNDLGVDRLGVIATRRLGGAVVRNRSKRIIRELFRRNKVSSRREGMDVVVLPRPGFSEVPFTILRADYLTTLQRDARGH